MSTGTGAPFVLVNMAMSADGKIATANRAVTTFGSASDQEHLHALRATCDAIVCGARTVEETDATLGNGPRPVSPRASASRALGLSSAGRRQRDRLDLAVRRDLG